MSTLNFDVISENVDFVVGLVMANILFLIIFYHIYKLLNITLEYFYFRWLKFLKKDDPGFMEDKKQ